MLIMGFLFAYPLLVKTVVADQVKSHEGEFAAIRTEGLRYLIIEDLRLDKPHEVSVDRIQVRMPLGLLIDRILGPGKGVSLKIEGVDARWTKQEPDTGKETTPIQLNELYEQVWSILSTAGRWLPRGGVSMVTLRRGDSTWIHVDNLDWDHTGLYARGWALEAERDFKFVLTPEQGKVRIELESVDWETSMGGSLKNEEGVLAFSLSGSLLAGDTALMGRFPESGVMPDQFEVSWVKPDLALLRLIPTELPLAGLEFYFSQDRESWRLAIHTDTPNPGAETFHWRIETEASGNRSQAQVDSLEIQFPFAEASLAEPVEFRVDTLTLRNDLQFSGWANLDHALLRSTGLSGTVSGGLQVSMESFRRGTPDYRVIGGLEWTGSPVELPVRIDLEGSGNLKRFDFHKIHFSADPSVVDASLALEFKDAVQYRSRFSYKIHALSLQPLVEGKLPFDSLNGSGDLRGSGAAYELTLSGAPEGIQLGPLVPLNAEYELALRPGDIDIVNLLVAGDEVSAQLAGKAQWGEGKAGLNLNTLDIRSGDQGDLFLEEPFQGQFEWRVGAEELMRTNWGRLSLVRDQGGEGSGLVLEPAGLAVDPSQIPLQLQINGLGTDFLRPWMNQDLPELRMETLSARGNLPLDGSAIRELRLEGQGSYEMVNGRVITWNAFAELGADRVTIEQMVAQGSKGSRLEFAGEFPVTLALAPEEGIRYEILWDQPMQIDGQLVAAERTLNLTRESHTLTVEDPRLELHLKGTPQSPLGSFLVGFEALTYVDPEKERSLDVSMGRLRGEAGPDRISIEELTLGFGGQQIQGKAQWPLSTGDIRQIVQEFSLDTLRTGSASLVLPEVDVATISAFLPGFIRDTGSVSGRIHYNPEDGFQGNLAVAGFSLRQIGNGLTFNDITGQLDFDDYRYSFDNLTGSVSGRLVNANGWLEVIPGESPLFSIEIRGESFPLTRTSDLVLRGDVDLALRKLKGDRPAILGGKVDLKNSLFLMNLVDLAQPGAASADSRPPYFSITQEPFANWGLDLQITGTEFLRADTTVLRGSFSTDLKLEGTLRSPFLLGTVSMDSGDVFFPFGRFKMETGYAEFTLSDPYDPVLSARGRSRSMGYDIQLDLGGSLSNPQFAFDTNPTMTDEETILLLTGGVLPGNDNASSFTQNSGRLALYLSQGFVSDLLGSSATERIHIGGGEEISKSGRETFYVEFDIKDDISVIGEYDQYDRYNLDARWRIRSK